jgi:hypothetical protein
LLANPLATYYDSAFYETQFDVSAYAGKVTSGQLDLAGDRFYATATTDRHDRYYGEGLHRWETWDGRSEWLRQPRYPLPIHLPYPELTIVGKVQDNGERPPYAEPATLEMVVDAYLTSVEPGPPAEIRGRLCAHATLTFDGLSAGPRLPAALYADLGRWIEKDVAGTIDLYHDAEGRPCRLQAGPVRMDLWGFDEPVTFVRPPDIPPPPPGTSRP